MFEKEKKKIISLFHENVYGVLQDCRAFLAGGAITSVFTNKPVNDLDIYFPSRDSFSLFLRHLYGREVGSNSYRYMKPDGAIGFADYVVQFYTNKAIMGMQDGDNTDLLQLICERWYSSIEDIFSTFDFTINMGAYDFASETITLHDDFLKHNSQRYLHINPDTSYPIVTALRVNKYRDRGYNISKAQYLRLLFAISQKQYKDWDSAKAEIGGLYGANVADVFDTSKEFSIEELLAQLEKAEELFNNTHNTAIATMNTDFPTISTHLGDKLNLTMFGKDIPQ